MTMSKRSFFAARYCATEMGLMSIQGLSLFKTVGICSNRERMEIPLPLLLMARRRMFSSRLTSVESPADGRRLVNLQKISSLVSSINS